MSQPPPLVDPVDCIFLSFLPFGSILLHVCAKILRVFFFVLLRWLISICVQLNVKVLKELGNALTGFGLVPPVQYHSLIL